MKLSVFILILRLSPIKRFVKLCIPFIIGTLINVISPAMDSTAFDCNLSQLGYAEEIYFNIFVLFGVINFPVRGLTKG